MEQVAVVVEVKVGAAAEVIVQYFYKLEKDVFFLFFFFFYDKSIETIIEEEVN